MLTKQENRRTLYPCYVYKEQTNLEKICSAYGVTCDRLVINTNDSPNKKRVRLSFYRGEECLCAVYRDIPIVSFGTLDDLVNEEEFLSDVNDLLKEQTRIEYKTADKSEDDKWQPIWLCSMDRPPHDDIWAWVTVKEYSYDREFVFAFPCQYYAETGYWRYSVGNGSMIDFLLDGSVPSNYSHDGYVKYYMPIGYKPNSPEDDCVG